MLYTILALPSSEYAVAQLLRAPLSDAFSGRNVDHPLQSMLDAVFSYPISRNTVAWLFEAPIRGAFLRRDSDHPLQRMLYTELVASSWSDVGRPLQSILCAVFRLPTPGYIVARLLMTPISGTLSGRNVDHPRQSMLDTVFSQTTSRYTVARLLEAPLLNTFPNYALYSIPASYFRVHHSVVYLNIHPQRISSKYFRPFCPKHALHRTPTSYSWINRS